MVAAAKIPARSEVPVEFTWDLTPMFADAAAWEKAYAEVEKDLPKAEALEGTLQNGATALLKVFKQRDALGLRVERLAAYAAQYRDSDGSNPVGQALYERIGALIARARAAYAFVEPEVLALSDETLNGWLKSNKELRVYEFAIHELTRQRAHVRSAEVENVLAQVSEVVRAPGDVFSVMNDTDFTFPEIKDEKGKKVKLSHGRFGVFRESKSQRVRRDSFKAYFGVYKGFRNTLASTLSAAVRSHVINARLRNFGSAIEAALTPNNIPVAVYDNLITTIDANLSKLHRYMRLRKKIMGVKQLHVYDLYAPLVTELDMKFPYAEAQDTIKAALAPLGSDYANVLRRAFGERWIDVYENVGKTSGAYSGGAYGTPPYILMNYQDRLNDMFTLAHELGHSVHTFFAHKTQPYVYGGYTIFVAEVASTLDESLLAQHLLKTRDDAALRKRVIVEQLESIRTTIFRQVMFADFEREIHRMAERGEALTADAMSAYYLDLNKRYYGKSVILDNEIAVEWTRIPHFYYNFYVFQYATGLSAALALSQQILKEGQPAVDRYLRFLSTGSSRPSIDMLRDAGVDMATPAPIQSAMDYFGSLLDQLEKLI